MIEEDNMRKSELEIKKKKLELEAPKLKMLNWSKEKLNDYLNKEQFCYLFDF